MLSKVVLPSNEIFKAFPNSFQELVDAVRTRFNNAATQNLTFKYLDSDHELVNLENQEDFQTAIITAAQAQIKTLKIYVIFQESTISSSSKIQNNQDNENRNVSKPAQTSERTQISLKEGFSYDFSSEASRTAKRATHSEYMNNKMDVINNLIGHNVQKVLDENLKSILSEFISKLKKKQIDSDGIRDPFNIDKYQLESIPSFARQHTQDDIRERIEILSKSCFGCICSECSNIILGVAYFCLECSNYKCCENCEEKAEHLHPLLKIRIPSNTRNSLPVRLQPKYSPFLSPEKPNTFGKDSLRKQRFGNGEKKIPYAGKILLEDREEKIIKVRPLQQYQVSIIAENIGTEVWPKGVKLFCVNGIYRNKEKELLPLEPKSKQNIQIYLEAPLRSGRYLSQWKLYYKDDNKEKSFGESLFIEIQIEDRKSFSGTSNKEIFCSEDKESCQMLKKAKTFPDTVQEKLNQLEEKHSEEREKFARYLDDFFPGNLNEKYEFLDKMTNIEEKNISEIVELYLIYVNRTSNTRKFKSVVEGSSKELQHCYCNYRKLFQNFQDFND